MQKTMKKSVSMLLAVIMVFSLFTIVPFTAGAAVDDVLSEDDYLTFTAEADGATVTLNVSSGSNLQYNKNNSGWEDYTKGAQIDLENEGDYVRFSGKDTTFDTSKHFSITGKVACSGNVMSMRLNGGKVQGLDNLCFRYMFSGCTGLTTAPDLPETDLKAGCYSYMFNGCTSLTTAPELPATTLAGNCYERMFYGCTSLTTAPELPATMLAESCYSYMFNGCTSLTTAPELWATSLANNCYSYMFSGCESLTEAPELPATTLANYCYQNMFKGCTSLTEAPELTATTLASYCYSNMFRDCKSLTEAPELPATNLAQFCYASMFYGCTSLTKAPELPATDLAVSCYNYMFYGCTSLTELPALPATTLANNCYYGMFYGCSKICISDEAGTFGNITYSAEYRIPTTGEGTLASNALSYMFYRTGGKFKGNPDINTTYYVPGPETFKAYAKKLTGETYTIENLTGETTVAQLKEIIADQIDIRVTAQQMLVFAGKQIEDAKTLAEYNIVNESTIFLVIRSYTVTWLNYDNSELGTKTVQYGSTPTYNGEPPTKPEDANNTYTFAGWKVGETTYAPSELPAVTGDVTYTAQFTAKPKTLIAGHSLSLDGNIGINFYLDPSVAGLTVNEVTKDNLNYTFAWADVETTKAKVNVAEQANQKNFRVSEDGKYIIITCYVCAAEMTCGVNATFTLNGKTESESEPYTVRKYCDDSVLSENAQYKDDTELVELVKAMLNYGAMAQTVFGIKTDDLANDGLDYVMQDVTTEMFDTAILTANDRAADDIAANAPAGAGFKTSSLVFLSESTLRLYFAKENDSFNTSGMTKWNDYYYTQVVDIPAAQLDTLQQFNVSGTTLCYSALDYAKALAAAGNADNAALAKALYWYNQAANAYFE